MNQMNNFKEMLLSVSAPVCINIIVAIISICTSVSLIWLIDKYLLKQIDTQEELASNNIAVALVICAIIISVCYIFASTVG